MGLLLEEKEQGAHWFKMENYERACVHWTRALNHCQMFVAEEMVEQEAAEV